jgi:hypothetical protein
MERVEPTRRIALSVWWSLTWRSALALFAIGLARTFLVVALAMVFRMGASAIETTMRFVDVFLTLPALALATCEIVYRLLRGKPSGPGSLRVALFRDDRDVDRKLVKL